MKSLKRLFARASKGGSGAPPETPLWDHLDACGIAFRAPMQDLIARHGSFPSPWERSSDACVFGGTAPFLTGEDRPATFQFTASSDLSAPPERFWCTVDANPDHRLNYAKAVHALVRLFGQGEVHSGNDSTSRNWRFGHAQLSCTVRPPEKNQWRDTPQLRADRDRVMASICVVPNWRPAVTPQEAQWCASALPLRIDHPLTEWSAHITSLTRDLPGTLNLAPGPYFAPNDAAYMFVQGGGLIDILPRQDICTVELLRVTSGRGGPAATLSLSYQPGSDERLPRKLVRVAHMSGKASAFDALAEQLATRLGLGLNSANQVDI